MATGCDFKIGGQAFRTDSNRNIEFGDRNVETLIGLHIISIGEKYIVVNEAINPEVLADLSNANGIDEVIERLKSAGIREENIKTENMEGNRGNKRENNERTIKSLNHRDEGRSSI